MRKGTQTTSNIFYAPESIQITDISLPNEIIDGTPFIVNIKVKNNYPEKTDYAVYSPWCGFGMHVVGKNSTGRRNEFIKFAPLEERDVEIGFIANNNSGDTIIIGANCASSNMSYFDGVSGVAVGRISFPSLSVEIKNKLGNLSYVKYFSEGNEIRINYDPNVPKGSPYQTYPPGIVRY